MNITRPREEKITLSGVLYSRGLEAKSSTRCLAAIRHLNVRLLILGKSTPSHVLLHVRTKLLRSFS